MNAKSAKSKGRRLQDFIRDTLREIFKNQLEPDDILSRQMGGAGTDIVLSPAAKKLIIFDIEAKNQENLSVPAALRQASLNAKLDRTPFLIFTKNRGKVYAALEFEAFMKLIYNADVQQLLVEMKKREAEQILNSEQKPDYSIKPPEFKVI